MKLDIDDLEQGKWYKCLDSNDGEMFYGKHIGSNEHELDAKQWVVDKADEEIEYQEDSWGTMDGHFEEADMNFISQHLPDGHKDKIDQEYLLTNIL